MEADASNGPCIYRAWGMEIIFRFLIYIFFLLV